MKLRGHELAWAAGSLGTGALFNGLALFGLFYMTSALGLSAATAGTLLFAARLYDGVTDPIMGAISDRTRHAAGSRRVYLLPGAILLGLSFALLFNLPRLDGTAMILMVLGALLLYSTSYTIFTVPYLAMPPRLAPGYDDRTRLMSARVAFLIIGVLIGSSGGPLLVEMGGEGARGFSALGIGLGLVAIIAGGIAFFGTRDRDATSPDPAAKRAAPWRQLGSVFAHAPFRLLTLVKLLQLAVLALILACTPYFFRFVLQRETSDITWYLLTFSLSGLLSLPLWRMVIARFGKRNVYLFSILAYAIGVASWWLWVPGEGDVAFYARALFIGVASNGTLVCALALLPDTMEYDRLQSGEDRNGIMSGVFTTVEKVAGALGPLIVGVLLETRGFVSGAAVDAQPESAIVAVHLGISVVPAALCLLTVPLLLAYKLGRAELESAREARLARG
ncbi:MAG: MFS transporter [Pseudomonadota bacterium]